MDTEKIGQKIVVKGLVQGVGFRPFVHGLANDLGVDGTVRNAGGIVEIRAWGSLQTLGSFVASIRACSLPSAHIESVSISESILPYSPGFTVIESGPGSTGGFILPDQPLCPDCAAEMTRPENRRHNHYFNACAVCGPRFSLIHALPYDRCNTSMSAFPLCPECADEYKNPLNRRFHAEAISCRKCGPELFLREGTDQIIGEAAFSRSVEILSNGGVLLIKGIGGYHLACRPDNQEAVKRIRTIKKRECKPFAVMFPDVRTIEKHCSLITAERELLLSTPRPIVPLPIKDCNGGFVPAVLMGSSRCGCFLPYAPLQFLLLEQTGPLVMTSSNPSGAAIIYADDAALDFYRLHEADISGVLLNDREILRPVEDSVAIIMRNRTQIIRRSRGYAPAPLRLPNEQPEVLAVGGDLKSAFCLTRGDQAFMSQYFGDLEDPGARESYQNDIYEFQRLLNITPRLVVHDPHPGYGSNELAKSMAVPSLAVQHHHAHIASVMAEHHIHGPVLGVAFDGSGYGNDKSIWGGEFLLCNDDTYRRVAHLRQYRLVGGDQAARDARQTAACMLLESGIEVPDGLVRHTAILKAALSNGTGCHVSSSMGRLFDAVSAVLGVCDENEYEGQCAIALQEAAEDALKKGFSPIALHFAIIEQGDAIIINFADVLKSAVRCEQNEAPAFALGFHQAIAEMVADVLNMVRAKERTNQAALSGGVFQNSLLLDLCCDVLAREGFAVFFNQESPANDNGLALGQALIGGRWLAKREGTSPCA